MPEKPTPDRSNIFIQPNAPKDIYFNTSNEYSSIKNLLLANNIADRYDDNMYFDKFNRFGIIDPYNALTNSKEFVFFTKPDLCLAVKEYRRLRHVNILNNYPFFIDAVKRYPKVIEQLQLSLDANKPPLMQVLSNALTSTLDMPGLSSDSIETGANVMGTKISYRGTSYKSDENTEFSLEFEDTKNLDIYMLFKIYDEYEKLKWNGELRFKELDDYITGGVSHDDNASSGNTRHYGNRWTDYIINKILHDQISIYKFIVSDDGYRIIYWAKFTGCYPVDIPRDAFSSMQDGQPMKLTVRWKAQFVRDMDPIILYQFNRLIGNIYQGEELPIYDKDNYHIDGRWATIPYIDTTTGNDTPKNGGTGEYYLRWRIKRE